VVKRSPRRTTVVTFTRPEVIDVRQRVTVAKVTTVARALASLEQGSHLG
jgi:hypothetical protein